MRNLCVTSAALAIATLTASSAMAQTETPAADPPAPQQGATSDGLARQAALPPMEPLIAIFLDMDASRAAGVPVERDRPTFAVGEQIAVYSKFANVGRTNPGAVDGFMQLTSNLRVDNSAGQTIIDQPIPSAEFESVPYPYDNGVIPDAYFDSFKLTMFALPTPDVYTLTLTFTDQTRPSDQTSPVVITLVTTVE